MGYQGHLPLKGDQLWAQNLLGFYTSEVIIKELMEFRHGQGTSAAQNCSPPSLEDGLGRALFSLITQNHSIFQENRLVQGGSTLTALPRNDNTDVTKGFLDSHMAESTLQATAAETENSQEVKSQPL